MDANPGWTSSGEWGLRHAPAVSAETLHGNPDPMSGATGSRVYGVNLSGDYNANAIGTFYLKTGAINCAALQQRAVAVPALAEHRRGLRTCRRRWRCPMTTPTGRRVYANSGSVTDATWVTARPTASGTVADGSSTVYIRWGYRVIGGAWPFSGWEYRRCAGYGHPGGIVGHHYFLWEELGTPYPSTKTVSGMSGTITDVKRDAERRHAHMADGHRRAARRGPAGQKAMLMSRCWWRT